MPSFFGVILSSNLFFHLSFVHESYKAKAKTYRNSRTKFSLTFNFIEFKFTIVKYLTQWRVYSPRRIVCR